MRIEELEELRDADELRKPAKFIRNGDNCIVIQLATGEYKTVEYDKINLAIDIMIAYDIINADYSLKDKRYILDITDASIRNYCKLYNESSDKTRRLKLKLDALGTKIEQINENYYNSLMVTDYNSSFSKDTHAEIIQFIGEVPLTSTKKSQLIISCTDAVIDNQCVFSYMLPLTNNRIYILAEKFRLKHSFVDLHTVDEILLIMKYVYNISNYTCCINLSDDQYRKILIDTKATGINPIELEEYTVRLISNYIDSLRDRYENKGNELAVYYSVGCSIYESLNFNAAKLDSILCKLEGIIRYNNIKIGRKNSIRFHDLYKERHDLYKERYNK